MDHPTASAPFFNVAGRGAGAARLLRHIRVFFGVISLQNGGVRMRLLA